MATTSNKRIAKNTGFLFIRMLLIMLVTLYTSRVVLAQLGIDDYGVYMVVGGVVSMFGFLNSCMTTATQRYLNFELGKGEGNMVRVKQVFRSSILIHLIIALTVLLCAETVGLWFVNNKLTIPIESMFAANVVYQTALIAFCFNIMSVPFNAAIIAHEHMHLYAVVSIIEAALKLGIAFALIIFPADKLAVYGILVMSVHIIVTTIYATVARRRYEEVALRPVYEKPLFREMLSFAGWNMFGSLAWLIRGQGMGIVLNMFFGPALNAAKGVSDQISHAATNLNANFQTALNPQITKHYSVNNLEQMEILAYRGIKFSTYLLWMMALPLMLCSSAVLHIWLTEVPPYAPLFVVLILFDTLTGNLFGTPLMTSLSATGNIRNYQVVVSIVLLLILPAAWIALKWGMSPATVFYLNIIFNFLSGSVRFAYCHKQIGFSTTRFLKCAIVPVFTVMAVSGLIPLGCRLFLFSDYSPAIQLLTVVPIAIACIALTVWTIGLTGNERATIKDMILSKLHFHGKNM